MDYACGNYKHKRAKIFTTSDGFKYSQHKLRPTVAYLRCVLYQQAKICKGTAKLNTESKLSNLFFSDVVTSTLSNVEDIHFDGTFYTVPPHFYQLWTTFARFGRHILQVIHCLLTAKHE